MKNILYKEFNMVKRYLFIELNFTYRELFVLIVFVFAFSFNVNGQLIPTCSYNFTDTSGCYSLESYIEQPFTIEKKVESEEYVDVVTTPLAGDIDGDCVNELFAIKSNSTPKILIISGVTGKTIKTIKTAHFAAFSQTNFSIADIDNDGKTEIIIATSGYTNNPIELQKKLICYDLDGNVKWISDQQYREGEPEMFGSPKVADFNRDGIPEVYIYNELFNGLTGVKLTTGSKNGLGIVYVNTDLQGAISVAADLDDDPRDLELAAGYSIYKVALTNLDGMSGNQMIAYNYNNRRDGYTSIADVNNDNKLDVIVSTNGTTSALLYVYTLNNNICSLIAQGFPKYTQSNKEVSHTTIGNIKSINEKSILVTTPNLLTIFTYNRTISLQTSWEISTLDKSGHIGVTLFDFNNDGLHEIIFRDESHLQVYRSYGNIMRRIGNVPCPSWTQKEYPIITTTDVSGESKICVPCTAEVSFRGAKLTIFGSKDDNKWAPSRGVWNQYSYNPLFINDNLTIPQFQQNAANYQNKKYDNFYTQSNIIDDNGIFIKRAASMFGNIDCIHFLQESETFEVTFSISNKAESTQSVGEGLIVSFYDGDPSTTGKLLKSIEINRSIGIGQTLYNQRASFGNEPVDNLVMVVNSKKNNALPFSDSDFVQTECDYTDNISHLKIPQIITSADTICVGDSILFFGKYIKENKKHYHIINNINSCDSLIYVTDLKVNTCLTSCNTTCCYLDINGNNVNGANLYAVVECTHLDPNSNKLNVTFSVHNRLDAGLSALNGLPISIYQNNPMDNGKLLSTIYTQTVILPGQSISQLTFTVDFNLNTNYYIVVNSDQSSPIVFNNQSSIPECQYDDNIVKIVLPEIKTDFKTACYGDTIVYNNELYVFDIEKTIIHSDKQGCDSIIIFANFKFENCNFDYKCDEKCHLVIKENHQKFQIDSLLQSIDTVYQNSILSIDIDHDCVPEIVIPEGNKSKIYQDPSTILFIDSKTGKTKKKLHTGQFQQRPSAFVAGDIDADGEPEIIVAAEAYSNPMAHWNRLICYKLDGSIKWVSDTTFAEFYMTVGGSLGLADFNHDGIPEVYYGNSIFNAQTGVFLVSEYCYGKGYISNHFAVTIAGDFNGDGNLELAAGNTVYTVDIINKIGRNGNMMTPYQLSSDYPDGLTSMSDIDEDGVLDIVVTTDVWDGQIGLYVYNFINNTPNVITTINYRFNDNSTYRISQAQITKLTKDGENCILIGLQDKIHCYKFNKQTSSLYKTWEIEKAYGSEFKGVQAFDFNHDGLKEILVTGFKQIMIYNEINDKIIVIDSVNCKYSGKLAIVGTEDESLICIPCYEETHWIGNSGYSIFKLAIFGPPPGQRWAPARNIWHQYAYNPFFINDDGTVPQYMHNPATYKNGKYNNFMVQESLIDEDGNYPVAAASLTGTATCIDYDIATQQYTVDFSVHNRADASASALLGLAVSFYNGNPETSGTLIGV
ncbi:MAG TPA: VCBS repeat-containing protein, partial [Saprospiraceae bacterium]|nr:VCBS repeat-containing protein [Saprospiraceae bacterium]